MYLSIEPEERLDDFSMALLEDSINNVDETEEIGVNVLSQLRQQREQMEISNSSLENIQEVTSKSRKLLKAIAWKVCKEKLSLSLWIILLFTIDILLAYRIITNNGSL